MSIEDNKKLVRRYFEDARYDPNICDEIFAPRFQFHTIQHAAITQQSVESDPQSEKVAYKWLTKVWSADWSMAIDEMIAENDRVMVRWTFSGVQIGEYAGLPPTHKAVTYAGINIFRVAKGKIAEIWDISDRLWLWQQLGVLPEIKDAITAARLSTK
ncbi:MAG: ester cyclase [Chloroflexi bacterium]|nr:ester cyclase [Chloroflexota bacterium]